jgi:hypothetical protein
MTNEIKSGWSEQDNLWSRRYAAAHVQGVWTVTNGEGRAFSNEVYLTQEEAIWLAWSLSCRNVMWQGASYAECEVRYIERYIPAIHVLHIINLNWNKIDPDMKVGNRKAGPGNYKVIEPKRFRDQLRRDTLGSVLYSENSAK